MITIIFMMFPSKTLADSATSEASVIIIDKSSIPRVEEPKKNDVISATIIVKKSNFILPKTNDIREIALSIMGGLLIVLFFSFYLQQKGLMYFNHVPIDFRRIK
ncbi:MAG: LPXTG cell wall anchor domain-containing protein [Vagococcus sp.]